MIRRVADLTDDEIVDAVASFGYLRGATVYEVCQKLGVPTWDSTRGNNVKAAQADAVSVHDRMASLLDAPHVVNDMRKHRFMMRPEQMALRLVGKASDEIARMLAGAP